jgi:hypothetical protein
MRPLKHSVILICSCGVLAGCAYMPSRASLILDNHGGVGHEGRRVVLRRNGTYIGTWYTDDSRDRITRRGTYTLDASGSHLALSRSHGSVEHLYRVVYAGLQYWVEERERQQVTESAGDWLREISLRTEAK